MSWLGGRSRRELGANPSEYGMTHRPSSDGPPLNDLLEGDMAPRDIYDHPERSAARAWAWRHADRVRELRGKDKAYIWRAGPTRELNPGDWVAITEDYAKMHRRATDPSYNVCRFDVSASDVRWPGDDLAEWGYWGPPQMAASADCSYGRKPR